MAPADPAADVILTRLFVSQILFATIESGSLGANLGGSVAKRLRQSGDSAQQVDRASVSKCN